MKRFFIWLLRPIVEAILEDTNVEVKAAKSARYA